MIRNILTIVVIALICACGNSQNADTRIIKRHYEGLLPAADCPGILFKLDISNAEFSGDGEYKLSMTYLEAKDGKDLTISSKGKMFTLRGDATNINATVYQFIEDNDRDTMNFLYLGDSLIMLSRDLGRIDSGLNYTLKLKDSQ